MTSARASETSRWNLAAAVAAWAVPGLGHYLLGQRKRGVILLASISLLWISGLLIGGISVIDWKGHPAWFIGQMLVSPSLAVNYYHEHLMTFGPPRPGENPAFEPSFGHPYEQGVLFTALAGLLNLLAVLDVLYRDPNDPRYAEQPVEVAADPSVSTATDKGATP